MMATKCFRNGSWNIDRFRRSTRTYFAILIPLLLPAALRGQGTAEVETRFDPDFYLGVYGGLAGISHSGFIQPDFFANRPVFEQESVFREGYGIGGSAGLLFEVPFSDMFTGGFRFGYDARGAQFTQGYTNVTEVRNPDGSTQPARVVGTLDASLPYLNASPYLQIAIPSFPLYFNAGPTVLIPIGASYSYTESIATPAGSVFRSSNGRNRTLASGPLASAATMFGATVGAGTNLSLTERMRLFIEVQYSPTFGDVADRLRASEEWTSSSFGGTIGIRYGFGGGEVPVVEDLPIVAGVDTLRGDTLAPTAGDTLFQAGIVTPGGLRDTLAIDARPVQSTELHPLLPFVFFEQDSAVIPARYVQMDRRELRDFDVERLPRGSTLGVYHQLLNIIGQRMYRLRGNRDAVLTITGCVSQFENGDTALARRRAEAVREYIVTAWRLRPERMNVAVRPYPGLPDIPSLSEVDTLEGARENQRVELASTVESVLAPVELRDTAFLGSAGLVRFLPPTDTLSEFDYWALNVNIGDSVVDEAVTGFGQPPREIDVEIDRREGLDLRDTLRIYSTFSVRDTLMNEIASDRSREVVILQRGDYMEQPTVVNGKEVAALNLFLFGFDMPEILEFTRQAAPLIRSRVRQNSTVRVIGHTDRIGLPNYNRELSQRRADIAALLLDVPVQEKIGMGEKSLLYDNETPEGRYYSRTVTVQVETPIVMQSAIPATRRGGISAVTPVPAAPVADGGTR